MSKTQRRQELLEKIRSPERRGEVVAYLKSPNCCINQVDLQRADFWRNGRSTGGFAFSWRGSVHLEHGDNKYRLDGTTANSAGRVEF